MSIHARIESRRDPLDFMSKLAIPAIAIYSVANLAPPFFLGPLASTYLGICIAVMAGAVVFERLPSTHGWAPILILCFGLTMVPGLTGLLSESTEYGKTKALGVMLAVLAPISTMVLLKGASARVLFLKILVLISAISAVVGVAFGVDPGTGRISAIGQDPIAAARLAGVLLVVSMVILLRSGNLGLWRIGALVLGALVAAAAMVQSGSRGPLLAATVAVLVVGLLGGARQRRLTISALVVLWLVVKATRALAPAYFEQRAFSTGDSGRSDLNSSSLHLFLEHPMGVGWGNLAKYITMFHTDSSQTLYTHNLFLEFAVEGGGVALLGILIVIGASLLTGIISQQHGAVEALTFAIFLYALMNAQLSSDIVGNRMLWVLIGAVLVLRVGNESRTRPRDEVPCASA